MVPVDTGDTRDFPSCAGLPSGCRNNPNIVDDSCRICDFDGGCRLSDDVYDEEDVLRMRMM